MHGARDSAPSCRAGSPSPKSRRAIASISSRGAAAHSRMIIALLASSRSARLVGRAASRIPSASAMRLGRAARVLHGGGQVAGLQVDGQLARRLAELVDARAERGARVAEAAAVVQHAAEHEQQRGALARGSSASPIAASRCATASGRPAAASARPSSASTPARPLRRAARAARVEVAHGGARHALGQRAPAAARSRPTTASSPAGRGLEQVRAHLLAGRAGLDQQRAPPAGGSARARRTAARRRSPPARADG